MTYKIPILIQKLNDSEEFDDFYSCHANINKANGNEYFNQGITVSKSTLNFKIRYTEIIKDIMYETTNYRIIYDARIFDIINVDDKNLEHNELTLVGEYHG